MPGKEIIFSLKIMLVKLSKKASFFLISQVFLILEKNGFTVLFEICWITKSFNVTLKNGALIRSN